jgi:hypothetical protein
VTTILSSSRAGTISHRQYVSVWSQYAVSFEVVIFPFNLGRDLFGAAKSSVSCKHTHIMSLRVPFGVGELVRGHTHHLAL